MGSIPASALAAVGITADRVERGLPVAKSDLGELRMVIDHLERAASLPARVACETCWGASQYEGWVMHSALPDERHRGDCPAGCDFGYVILRP